MAPAALPDGRVPVVLSAHAAELVQVDAEAILRYLDRKPPVSAVAANLLRTRRLRRHRAVVRAADMAELADGLRAVAAGVEHPLVARSSESHSARTAFVFPGQGNQWASMGADAYRRLPVYRAHVEACADAFAAAGAESPLPYLTAEVDTGDWTQIEIQAAQFAHAVGLAQVWRSCGITPDVVLGHSLGEVAAGCVAGRLALADAAAVVIARAKVVDGLPGDYGMAVLGVSPEEAERLIAEVPGWLEVSVVNTAASVVVSGDREAVATLVRELSGRGLFARELAVNYPGHTSALEPLRDDLCALLPAARFMDTPIHFVGSATGDVVPSDTDFVGYWYRNLRQPVRFDRAVAAARRLGSGTFVELSAHPSLLYALGDLVDDAPHGPAVVVGSGMRDEPLPDTLAASITAAAVADADFRWAGLVDMAQPLLPGFPNAPMRAVRLWADAQPLPPVPGLTVAAERWEATPGRRADGPARRIAVIELAGPGGWLAERLRDAVARHAQLTDPRDAELLVAVAPVLDHPDAEHAARDIGRLIDSGLLDYPHAAGRPCRDICLVTVGGEHVRPGEPVALPAQAALAAVHRSLGFEYPDQTFRHLDLPSWDIDEPTAACAVDALLSEASETAVRGGPDGPTLHTRILAESAAAAWPLHDGLLDDVVITGGSGAVGLHFARYLAGRGARRIVLLSRAGVDPATVTELKRVASRGDIEVVAPRCDVTCEADVDVVAAQFGGGGASLVIHAAGAATFADRGVLTADAFADTAAAKVSGLARMAERWPMRVDGRLLACSSVSGVWGGRGHAAYSAANRMLDVKAGQLRADGRHSVAVRYGLWRTDAGRTSAITDAAEQASIERSGLLPMAPDRAIAASLRDHADDPVILAADRDRLQIFLDSQTATETPAPATVSEPNPAIPNAVLAEIAGVLNLGDAAAIDLHTSLLDLGLDSLLALDLRKRLRSATGRSVPLATLLGGITGGELIAALDTPEQQEKVETTRD